MRKCECGGKYIVVGLDESNMDDVEIECNKCGDTDCVEPDGLGMGGMEWVLAAAMTEERNSKQEEEVVPEHHQLSIFDLLGEES